MQERRKAHRSRTYIKGEIAFNNRNSIMDCLIRNMSDSGAKLAFSDAVALPDVFDVSVVHKGTQFRARTKWRSGHELGISFLSWGGETMPIPLEFIRRIRTCEAERASLRHRVAELTAPVV